MVVAGILPGTTSPTPFSYGPPEIWYLLPFQAPTKALDSNGDPIILEIVGKNFGTNLLQVFFSTYNKGPLGIRNHDNNIDTFIYPGTNHTSIMVTLPPFIGKNINLTVIANKQYSAPNGPQFSYMPPVVANVSSIAGRVLQSTTADPRIDNTDWASSTFGNCRPLLNANGSQPGEINIAFQLMLNIANGGSKFEF